MDTSLLQALATLETRDGQKSIKGPGGEDSFNLFNIKDFTGNGYRAYDKAEGSRDAYRVYGSREESIQDLVGLLERKYPKAYAALQTGDASGFANGLKDGGYATDPKYVQKLTSTIDSVRSKRGAADQAVTASAASGGSAVDQLVVLRDAGFDDIINDALGKGYKPDEIVKYIAGNAQKVGQDAHDKRAQAGVFSTAVEGLVDVGQRVARGAKQIVSSRDELAALQEQEALDRADPDKIALRSTTSAKVGAAAPLVASAFIPGVNGVVGASALGAAVGALQPTVEGESRTENAALGGLAGGAGVVGGKALGGLINSTTRGAQSALRGGRSTQEVIDQIRALESQGIQVSARDVSPFLNRVANSAEDVMGARFGQADRAATRDQQLARAITQRMGQEADTLDSTYISAAQTRIGKQFDDALDGVHVNGASMSQSLDDVIAAQKNGLTSLQSSLPTKVATELKDRIAQGPMTAVELQGLRSQIGKELSSPSLEASARQGLSDINASITQAIEGALPPAKAQAWQTANKQWRNLQAAENMVRMSNDTGEISARQIASAIKTGKNRASYERGEAPYQDLQRALSGLEDSKQGVIDPGLRTAAQALGAYHTGGLSLAASGITANMALRLMNSTNPQVRSMLLGLTPVKQAELKRLALAGALAMSNAGGTQ